MVRMLKARAMLCNAVNGSLGILRRDKRLGYDHNDRKECLICTLLIHLCLLISLFYKHADSTPALVHITSERPLCRHPPA